MKLHRSLCLLRKPLAPAPGTVVEANTQLRFWASQKATPITSRLRSLSQNKALGSCVAYMERNMPHARLFSTQAQSITSNEFGQPLIHSVFESKTGTWQYVVADSSTSSAVIIDPVLDFDPATRTITSESADSLLSLVKHHGYAVERILETHIHADHLSAASYIQSSLVEQHDRKPAICIGKRILQVQELFALRYGIPGDEYLDVFDHLFDDDEIFHIGSLHAQALHLPGHTPDHMGYKIGANVFCGDSVFHADIGTARCDFPGGDAASLYKSGRKLLGLPGHVKIWTGHDYPPPGRSDPVPWLSVEEHRSRNKHLQEGTTETVFVALRHDRDAKLAEPRLLHQALQMNVRAGRLPGLSPEGQRMLHLPIRVDGGVLQHLSSRVK